MRRYLDFCLLLAFCTCACLLLLPLLHRRAVKTCILFSEARRVALQKHTFGSALHTKNLRPDMYRDVQCSLQISTLGPPLFALLQARESSYRKNADVRKGGQKILKACRVPDSVVPDDLHQCKPLLTLHAKKCSFYRSF
jgi:hypothetical protein